MSLLTTVLADPRSVQSLQPAQWDELLRLARYARVTAKLHSLIESHDCQAAMPPAARDVLWGARRYSDYMQLQARRTLAELAPVLAALDCPVVLLKGAAYLMSGAVASGGRRLNDLDILLPKHNIPQAEELLQGAGWEFDQDLSDYDRRYYREWSHEIPPMRHRGSHLELDMHHNLIQPTGRIRLDANLLFSELQPVPGTIYRTLSATDMFLHSATHLFMSDELRGGLRDILDLHQLASDFYQQDASFWLQLHVRAVQLGLQRPLYYAASTLRRLMATAIPEDAWVNISGARPAAPVNAIMKRLIDGHLAPESLGRPGSVLAQKLLYLRSHWVRMPPVMLLKHLTYKWWSGLRSAEA